MLETLLQPALASAPNKPALVAGRHSWTYHQLEEQANRLAAHWTALGLQHGDRVATLLPNCPELVVAYLAGFKTGVILVPLPPSYQPPQTAYALRHSGSRLLLVQADRHERLSADLAGVETLEQVYITGGEPLRGARSLDEVLRQPAAAPAPPELLPRDLAIILYTSGTTSRPKGVTFTRAALEFGIRQWLAVVPFGVDEVALISSPLSRPMALRCQLLPLLRMAGTAVLLEQFTADGFLRTFGQPPRKTSISVHPAGLRQVLDHPAVGDVEFAGLRLCTSGGDRVPAQLQEAFRQRTGLELTEQCGMTEASSFCINPPFGRKKVGSIGLPFYGTRIRLVDGCLRDVPFSETGEILVQSDAIMDGYWNDTAQTRRTLRDGWVATGDLARIDTDGYLWFQGRKKDTIIRDGWNVSPAQVEEVLLRHPAVAQAVVMGVPDVDHGQTVVAIVVPRPGADPRPSAADLTAHMGRHLEPVSVPERLVFSDHLPTTAAGKLDRERLRWWAEAGTAL
jgi:acyl-CoA synthetase (AMP-forming)/AMP-acid ligase II